jgi:hypothetical protein
VREFDAYTYRRDFIDTGRWCLLRAEPRYISEISISLFPEQFLYYCPSNGELGSDTEVWERMKKTPEVNQTGASDFRKTPYGFK